MTDLITLSEIEAARSALPGVVRRTPIVPLAVSAGDIGRETMFLKAENLQVTGAYKVRSAFHVLGSLTIEQRSRGVIMSSSGNFAQGFAYAGRVLGVPIAVVMLRETSGFKIDATRGHGADVIFCDESAERRPTVLRVAAERGMTEIDTWEHREVPIGHGSIGLEIVEDFPELTRVLVPVSTGGLAAGVAVAVKERRPDVEVIGVQPERANAAFVSRQAGIPTEIDYWDSLADGLSARRPGEFPFRHLQRYLDDIVLVSEHDIARAFAAIWKRTKLVAEPAGAVATAAFTGEAVDAKPGTVAVLSGGNVADSVVETMQRMASS